MHYFSIHLYENQNGEPVVEKELEEIESQTEHLHALLIAGLNKLKQRQYHRPPLSEPLGDGLFELRVGGRDIARALWFFQHGQRIVVVRCFIKKTQKTPKRELELARRRMNDFIERYK